MTQILDSAPKSEVNPSDPRREEHVDTVPDELWEILEPCWSLVTQSRPKISNLLSKLRGFDPSDLR
jgi:hypothetical protein